MLTEQQQQMLAEATKKALEARNLTVHGAHIRLGISRESLTRMLHGRPPEVLVVERFARELGLDVNDWRELAGYPRVESKPKPELTYEPVWDEQVVRALSGANDLPPEDREALREEIERLIAEKRRKLGHD